ncbi:hypothetical protein AA313_de0200204 [Arthrobotrys entomopaga]|nr:hypothetical protein AA313_de0200204 [Arthrobotrys entomopaga]
MRPRTFRQSLLRKDPTTSAQAAQNILALANSIGWTDSKHRRAGLIFPKEKAMKCSICGDTFLGYELERLGCTHRHCRECLQGNYRSVINSPESYPPKCCDERALPVADTCHVLTDEEMKVILEMKDNYESSKVVPCFSCQGDIYLSDTTQDAAYCLKCNMLTCMTCRKEMHNDLCPEDPDTETLKSLAKEEGWTQCPKCSRLIQRTTGCNSMICVCKTNFCFRCGNGFPCKCFGTPRTDSPGLKSQADITFGAAFAVNKDVRKADYKERLNNIILKRYHRAALKNSQNQKFQLKDLKVKRQEKEKEVEAAKEIIKLRIKMNELAQIEKAQRRELRLKALENRGGLADTKRVIVTRRNVYVADEDPMPVDDLAPVGRRTRTRSRRS